MAGRATMDLFQEAVRATVMRWTALNLAVSYEFGDGHSENHRREELIQQMMAGFASAHAANKRAPDPTELEDFLDTYLQDHFNLFADDDSPHEVSVLICRLYELIAANRILEAQQLLSTPTAALDACVAMAEPNQEVDPPDSGDSDDDDKMDEGGGSLAAPGGTFFTFGVPGANLSQAAAAPRVEERVELSEEQQADLDDGWGVVVKSNKGRVRQVMAGQGGGGPPPA